MLPELSRRLLANWSNLPLNRPKPERLHFLGMRTQVGDGYALFFGLADDDPQACVMVKIARVADAGERLRHEWTLLGQYSQDVRPGMRDAVPQPVALEEVNGAVMTVFTAPAGMPLDAGAGRDASHFNRVLDWLIQFNTATRVQIPVHELARKIQPVVAEAIDTFELSQGEANILEAWANQILHGQKRSSLDVFDRHGNLSTANIWLNRRQLTVINWERATHADLPLLDLFSFMTLYRFPNSRRLPLEAFLDLFRGAYLAEGSQVALVGRTIAGYCRALGVPLSQVEAHFGLFLAHSALDEFHMLTAAAERGYLPLLASKKAPVRHPYRRAIKEQLWASLLKLFVTERDSFRRIVHASIQDSAFKRHGAKSMSMRSGDPVQAD